MEESTKRNKNDYIENDTAAMMTAMVWALRSKDPSTQVGAVFLNEEGRVISCGYNGAPNGWSNNEFPWLRADDITKSKYTYVIHAEMNAIFNHRKDLDSFRDSTLYVTLFPCSNCAKHIAQLGVKKVIYLHEPIEKTNDMEATRIIFEKCNIECTKFNIDDYEKLREVSFDLKNGNARNFSKIKRLNLKIKLNNKKDNE